MTREIFDELMNDPAVFKVETVGGRIFKDPNDIVAIQFYFMHVGDFSEIPPKKRLYLSTFPLENLISEIRPYPIIHNTLTILANTDTYEYALAYSLVINPEERKIEIKITEHPILGMSFITQEEITGVTIYY